MITEPSINQLNGAVSTLSLAYIAISAGAEIYLPEIKNLLKSIGFHMFGIWIFTMTAVIVGTMVLVQMNPDLNLFPDNTSIMCKAGISSAIAAIMVCRSPSSALAVATECESKGPFTKKMLGVTVVSDVVSLITFAIALSFARSECYPGSSFDGFKVLLLFASMIASVFLGLIFGMLFFTDNNNVQ